jgi:hypothetical protein
MVLLIRSPPVMCPLISLWCLSPLHLALDLLILSFLVSSHRILSLLSPPSLCEGKEQYRAIHAISLLGGLDFKLQFFLHFIVNEIGKISI